MLRIHAASRFSGIILALMLIFNHVGLNFIPSGRFKMGFLVFNIAWTAFGCAYVFTRGFSGFLFQ